MHTRTNISNINEAMCDVNNMVGHVTIPRRGIVISTDFAGAKSNLAWFNSGEADLLLCVELNNTKKSFLIKPGFGFCFGRSERIRVTLSLLVDVKEMFTNNVQDSQPAHVLFFGSGVEAQYS